MCQSSTGNGKSVKQREREQRAGWFSEETTGQLFDTTLFNTVLLTAEMVQKNFIYMKDASLYRSILLIKFHGEVRCQGQLQVSVLLWLNDGFFALHAEYCFDL